MNFSPSLMNAFDKIANDTFCGLYFEAHYVKKVVDAVSSDAMKLGQYFEYICTGATLRGGEIPIACTTQKGELTAPYKAAHIQKVYWDVFAKKFELSDIKTGVELLIEHNGKTIKGICDVVCKTVDEEVAIIDLKYTGFIDNKWDDYGWGFADMGSDWRKMLQAVVYCHAYELLHGVRPTFYFYVASSNTNKRRIFKVVVTDKAIERMLKQVDYTAEMIDYHNAAGWNGTQNYLNCIDCPLFETCEAKITMPMIQHVTV